MTMNGLLIAFLIQAFVPPPGPPQLAPEGPVFEQRRAKYAEDLRRACLSEEGVSIAVEAWEQGQRQGPERASRQRAVDNEVGAAVFAQPIDIARVESALRARSNLQAQFSAERNDRSIEVLKRLSPEDRVIFARRLTGMRSATPLPSCPAARP